MRYDDIARELVHQFKYGDRLDLAPMLGQWMARAGRELIGDADAFVPAVGPTLQSVRRAGDGGVRPNRVPVLPETLERVRATPQQVGLDKTERAADVQGAFKVAPERRPDGG